MNKKLSTKRRPTSALAGTSSEMLSIAVADVGLGEEGHSKTSKACDFGYLSCTGFLGWSRFFTVFSFSWFLGATGNDCGEWSTKPMLRLSKGWKPKAWPSQIYAEISIVGIKEHLTHQPLAWLPFKRPNSNKNGNTGRKNSVENNGKHTASLTLNKKTFCMRGGAFPRKMEINGKSPHSSALQFPHVAPRTSRENLRVPRHQSHPILKSLHEFVQLRSYALSVQSSFPGQIAQAMKMYENSFFASWLLHRITTHLPISSPQNSYLVKITAWNTPQPARQHRANKRTSAWHFQA